MSIDKALLQQAGGELLASQRVLIISHIHPDGDAIGSLLGLGLALETLGKDVTMVLADGIPGSFRYLNGSSRVVSHLDGTYDMICVVDCSDRERTGNVLPAETVIDLNIDHHATNLNFARLNLVDTQAAAAAEIVIDILRHIAVQFSPAVVEALLTGLVTDTIGFRTSSTTPKTLRLAADLMEAGGDLSKIYRLSLITRSYEAARLWGAGLTNIQREGGLTWTTLTREDRQAVNYPGRDDADLINVLSSVDGIDIALIFIEQSNGNVKVSWRAQPGFDVSQVALSFGGGGHAAASGAEISGSLQQVRDRVLEATRPLLNHQNLASEQS
ncbi:MAG: DHH family phosphoesterase [Anaerolineales bacterium]|nr:DHH family phosphoesterase [Anaerolineales bacterium]